MRRAGRDHLSLALMDARNHTLGLFGWFQQALQAQGMAVAPAACLNPPLWELGHVGWFQEWWIARNLQRAQGTGCDPDHARLASIEPQADRWWDSARVPHASRFTLDVPSANDCKKYLLETLETTLELLEKTPDNASDDTLYFYRLCLFHEDMHGEALAYTAQTLGLTLSPALRLAFSAEPLAARAPLMLPATRWLLGSASDSGFIFDNERGAHTVSVPEFEIDAQPVSWSQYVEFVADGGYDREPLWHPQGWQWLQALAAGDGRRGPRYVEEIGVSSGAVVQTRFGLPMRMAGNQSAMHMSWWEADAWCRWAGRRLPSEVEWEVAAHTAANRGFRWGELWEWTGSTFRSYPGFRADPYRDYSEPWFGSHKVLRGASFATSARMKNPKYRNFYLPDRDDIFCGFRSCSL
ncbi:MAG: SUMF1/EgtB/PvdO family nonheme iron enzyme [Polaromonas sp.]|nr:SUMF1/EgtB/PvdO family nonheme iron enzyme [Polaromonas sp.]